jgi:sugar lactone lactonase YvrE
MKKHVLIFAVIPFMGLTAKAQYIYTVAGNHIAGFSCDGGMATAAELSGPNSIAFDNSSNYYIAENGNCVIRKVNTSGIISTIAGTPHVCCGSGDGGQATDAELEGVDGMVIDKSNNLYFSDGTAFIRKINSNWYYI